MKNSQRIINALKGEKVDKVPLTIYGFLLEQAGIDINGREVKELRKKGLGIIRHTETYKISNPQIETKSEIFYEYGSKIVANKIITPEGELSSLEKDGWVKEHFLKRPEDYKIMQHVIDSQIITPDYDNFYTSLKEVEDEGIVVITGQRSPFQKILVDFAGLEEFSFHLADGFEEFSLLYEALNKKLIEIMEVISRGPGNVVKIWENLSGDIIGSKRYDDFVSPVYEIINPLLKSSQKLLALHYDGRLNCIKEDIKKAKFDIVESFTPPPEGDLTLEEAIKTWSDKVFWLTIPSFAYESEGKLRKYIQKLLEISNRKNLVLEIAEYFPGDKWYYYIEIILDELSS